MMLETIDIAVKIPALFLSILNTLMIILTIIIIITEKIAITINTFKEEVKNSLENDVNRLLIVKAGIQIATITLFKNTLTSSVSKPFFDKTHPINIKVNNIKTASIDFINKIWSPLVENVHYIITYN